MSNKRKKWLSEIKSNATTRKITSTTALEELEKKGVPYYWHIIMWMSLGIAITLFLTSYFNTLKENRELRAGLLVINQPFVEAKFTTKDNHTVSLKKQVEDMQRIMELPPPFESFDNEQVDLPNLDYETIEI